MYISSHRYRLNFKYTLIPRFWVKLFSSMKLPALEIEKISLIKKKSHLRLFIQSDTFVVMALPYMENPVPKFLPRCPTQRLNSRFAACIDKLMEKAETI